MSLASLDDFVILYNSVSSGRGFVFATVSYYPATAPYLYIILP